MSAAPFIAISLLLILVIAVLALFLSGRNSIESNCDQPKPDRNQKKIFKEF